MDAAGLGLGFNFFRERFSDKEILINPDRTSAIRSAFTVGNGAGRFNSNLPAERSAEEVSSMSNEAPEPVPVTRRFHAPAKTVFDGWLKPSTCAGGWLSLVR